MPSKEFRDYVYVRRDPVPDGKKPASRRGLWAADRAAAWEAFESARDQDFSVHARDVVVERVSAAVAASGRPKLMKLLRKLGPETGIVVHRLDELGRDVADVLKTIRTAQETGAEVYSLDISFEELATDSRRMNVFVALANMERLVARQRAEANSKGRGVAGGRVGRPPSLDFAAQAKIRAALKAGEGVSVLARRFNTSRQTVLRIRDAKSGR